MQVRTLRPTRVSSAHCAGLSLHLQYLYNCIASSSCFLLLDDLHFRATVSRNIVDVARNFSGVFVKSPHFVKLRRSDVHSFAVDEPEVEAPKSISSRMMPWLPFPTPSRWVATRSHSTHAPLIPSIRAHVHPFSLLLSPQFERHGHPVIRARREHALSQPPCSAAAAALARHGIAPTALARCGRHRPRVTELSDYSSTWL